jgi:hypothetical protein
MNTNAPIEIQKINFQKNKTSLSVKVIPEFNKTSQIRGFDKRLLEKIPSLNYHLCDNRDKRSFAEELQDTELAHAFEHALLDMIGRHDDTAEVVGGYTSWNWQKKNPTGYG